MEHKSIKRLLNVIGLFLAMNFGHDSLAAINITQANPKEEKEKRFQMNQILRGHVITTTIGQEVNKQKTEQKYLLCYHKTREGEEYGIFGLPNLSSKEGTAFYEQLVEEIRADAEHDAIATSYGEKKDLEGFLIENLVLNEEKQNKDNVKQTIFTGNVLFLRINDKLFDFEKLEIKKIKGYDPDLYLA